LNQLCDLIAKPVVIILSCIYY